jgi:hypothetical protein
MKTRLLAGAIIAGVGGTLGISTSAQALNLNPLGSGQVLLYPYYTVNAGNQTVISVVNKTDAGKAVKVRLREGRNSRVVVDFNLYLSPFDVWTASLFSRSDSGPDNPGNLVTTDNSCVVPRIKGNPNLPQLANGNRYIAFPNSGYSGANDDAGPDTLDRTREGHLELIEMGAMSGRENTSLAAIIHGASGVPANCLQVERAWLPAGSASAAVAYWTANALTDIDPPGGGLFGSAVIVDALAGIMMGYDAEAIEGFSGVALHTAPDAEQPTLSSARSDADSATAYVVSEGAVVTSTYPAARAIDAVSALFAQDRIYNEFVTSESVGGASEWVITFPTKYAYTDQALVGNSAIAPFTHVFPTAASAQNSGSAAIEIDTAIFNREDRLFLPACPDINAPDCLPSPFPPPPEDVPQLSWASNVISFRQANAVTAGSTILGSRLTVNFPDSPYFPHDGWLMLMPYWFEGFPPSTINQQRLRPDNNGGIWNGLPIIGFWAASYTNGQLTPGVLSNYAGAYRHRGRSHYVVPAAP